MTKELAMAEVLANDGGAVYWQQRMVTERNYYNLNN